MIRRDIIAIGASAGGIEALKEIVSALPAQFPAALFVVVHIAPQSRSVLPDILMRACNRRLTAAHDVDGTPVRHGHIFVAPPDHHLVLQDGHARLARGPKENGARPAVDPLFRSAARWYGPRVIGVVLSGNLDDGAAGLLTIKRRGGVAVVQSPADAAFPGMPQSAAESVVCDLILPANRIGAALVELTAREVPEPEAEPIDPRLVHETLVAESRMNTTTPPREEAPSTFGCPECGGTLWEVKEGGLVRYRCRVGHAYSAESLLSEQSHSVEAALWSALRALEEAESLSDSIARRMERRGSELARKFAARAHEARDHAAIIRRLLTHGEITAQET